MNRSVLASVVIAAFVACGAPALGGVDVDIHVGIPPPPAVVFESEPEVVIVPETHVYYAPQVTDYDMYRLGRYWYVNRDGYWYRARTFRGPFRFVDAHYVPRQIFVVPVEYRRHPSHPPKPPKRGHGHGHHKHDHDDD